MQKIQNFSEDKKDRIARVAIITSIFLVAAISIPNNAVRLFSAIAWLTFVIIVISKLCPTAIFTKKNCYEERRKILVEREMGKVGRELGI